jgi:hypothetical protein
MRAYMEALSPAARTMLLRAMRNAQDRGEIDPSAQAIIRAAAGFDESADKSQERFSSAKPQLSTVPWGDQIREAFFAPVQPFVCALTFATKIAARIQQASLDGIWTFLIRDFAPEEFVKALALDASEGGPDAAYVSRKLRRELTPKLAALLQSGDVHSKPIRRLAAQLGSEAALQDLFDVVYIFEKEGAFLNYTGQLPKTLSAYDLSDVGPVSELTKKAMDDLHVDPAFLAVLLLQRSTSPIGVAALAMALAGTTDSRSLQSSPFARIVDTVISEAELWVHRFATHLRDRSARLETLLDLREYHDLVRQLDLSLQPHQVPVWHRRLGGARKEMSDLIAREIEPLPGLVRRALRIESSVGGFSGAFDAEMADDAEFGIRLLLEARNALDSLALNDMVTKLRRPVEQTIEVVTAKLMTELKSDAVVDRTDILNAVDAAIRMSAIIFGEDYAAILRKSRDMAANKSSKLASG